MCMRVKWNVRASPIIQTATDGEFRTAVSPLQHKLLVVNNQNVILPANSLAVVMFLCAPFKSHKNYNRAREHEVCVLRVARQSHRALACLWEVVRRLLRRCAAGLISSSQRDTPAKAAESVNGGSRVFAPALAAPHRTLYAPRSVRGRI